MSKSSLRRLVAVLGLVAGLGLATVSVAAADASGTTVSHPSHPRPADFNWA